MLGVRPQEDAAVPAVVPRTLEEALEALFRAFEAPVYNLSAGYAGTLDAVAKIQALVDYVEGIRVGAHPAPGRVNFLLSYFWGLENHARWPVVWPSAVSYLEFATGEALPATPAERYGRYLQLVRELDADHDRFERVASWWDQTKPVLLDPVLAEHAQGGVGGTEGGPSLGDEASQQDVEVGLPDHGGSTGNQGGDAVEPEASNHLQDTTQGISG